jgi:hypothetical protein
VAEHGGLKQLVTKSERAAIFSLAALFHKQSMKHPPSRLALVCALFVGLTGCTATTGVAVPTDPAFAAAAPLAPDLAPDVVQAARPLRPQPTFKATHPHPPYPKR